MGKIKKLTALLACTVMVAGSLAGCGSATEPAAEEPAAEKPATEETTATEEPAAEEAGAEETAEGGSEVISDETATLRMYGPGLFAAVGEEGTTDIITGLTRPGYNVVVERWNELYPNVTLEIEPIPWDNWKAAIQTAALSGDYDILIHGNGNADYCLDLTEYLEKDPEVKDALTFYPYRRNPENMTEVRPYGLSYTLNPVTCIIDKEILTNYGVEIPDASWTLEDMTAIAEACTGTDPVSGKATYGISMVKASDAYKNYILIGRAMNNEIFEFSPKLSETKVNFDTPETQAVFDYMANLGKFSSPDYLEGLDLANAWTVDHNLAMVWGEDVFNIYNKIKAAGLEDRFLMLPLPKMTEGIHQGVTSSNMGDSNICIYKETEQKELAWAFLKFLVTDPVVQDWFIETNSIPANVNYTSLLYDAMPAEYADAVAEIIETSPEGYNSSASVWYDSTWFGTFQSDIVTEFDSLLKGNETSADVTKNIQNTVNGYLQSLE